MSADRAAPWRTLGVLFVAGLALRLLFWSATSDADWAYSIAFKGDAALWLRYAAAISAGLPENFELGLPLRPPGNAYLLAAINWLSAGSLLFARVVYLLIGSAIAPMLYLALRHPFGVVPATLAAALCAASTSLLLLANSLSAETPYLLISIASLWGVERLRQEPQVWHLVFWSVAQGLACLLRAEHLCFVILMYAWLARGWLRKRRIVVPSLIVLLGMLATLAPWQFNVSERIGKFNVTSKIPLPVPTIPWDADAQRALWALPAFCRSSVQGFVSACVRHRGRERVVKADLEILTQAYGYVPEPLTRYPFVALYGPLNFFLANNAEAEGGFSQAPLQRRPVLEGGRGRYDPLWIDNLPLDGHLAFEYPPHLQCITRGYALGLQWIWKHPGAYLSLAWKKLTRFWAGAAHGLGGYAQPLGLSGRRHPVDLLCAQGLGQTIYAVVVFVAALCGLVSLRRRPELWPLLLWLLSKVIVTLGFFGYARQGALIVPVVALLVAIAWQDRLRPLLSGSARRRLAWVGAMLCVWLLLSEVWRTLSPPEIWVDGRHVDVFDPWPVDVHRVRSIEYR